MKELTNTGERCAYCGSGTIYKYGGKGKPVCAICAGVTRPRIQPIKVEKKHGRNESCPCGSGKKYKYCCL